MAKIPDDNVYDASPGGGGMVDTPWDISGAKPTYDPITGQFYFAFPDGSPRGGGGQPGGVTSAPNGIGGTGFMGTMPNVQDRGSFAPYGGAQPGGGGGGGGVPLGGKILDWAKKLGIPLGVAAAGRVAGSDVPGGSAGDLPPELQELLRLSMDRMRSQEPLFQAINRQALGGLPDYAKQGGQ